jgi:tetratricopeptide (TPR) repeat protein
MVEARMNRALAEMGLKNPQAAIDDLSQALADGAPYTRIYFMRARAREAAGDHPGAARDRAEGLGREPGDEASWVARGVARLPADPEGALADFEQALRLNQGSRLGLRNKAAVLSELLKRPEEAVAALDRAVQLRPGDALARAGRGILLARLGRREDAQRDAREVMALTRQPALVYQVAGIYALTSASHPEDRRMALNLLWRAIRDEPSWVEVAPRDPDLAPLHADPGFQELVRKAASSP